MPSKFFKLIGISDQKDLGARQHIPQERLRTSLGCKLVEREDLRVDLAAQRRLGRVDCLRNVV